MLVRIQELRERGLIPDDGFKCVLTLTLTLTLTRTRSEAHPRHQLPWGFDCLSLHTQPVVLPSLANPSRLTYLIILALCPAAAMA